MVGKTISHYKVLEKIGRGDMGKFTVLTGDGASVTRGPLGLLPELNPPRGHNAIYVCALPE